MMGTAFITLEEMMGTTFIKRVERRDLSSDPRDHENALYARP